MGWLDKLESAANILSNELEKKQASVEKRARNEVRSKVRHCSDETLRYNLQKAKENGNYIFEEEIEKEMERRARC